MNDDVFEWRLVAARLRSGWRAVTAIAALRQRLDDLEQRLAGKDG